MKVKYTPFNTQADLAAAEINQFVNTRTRGNIPHLVEPLDVSQAHMVFVNAVHFKGFWEHQFSPRNTARERFVVTPGRHSLVDMMARTGMYDFGNGFLLLIFCHVFIKRRKICLFFLIRRI